MRSISHPTRAAWAGWPAATGWGAAPRRRPPRPARPRRYGWHATLKAPFALAPGADWITLHQAVQSVARGLQPFVLPPLQVQRIDDFLALVPPAVAPPQAPHPGAP